MSEEGQDRKKATKEAQQARMKRLDEFLAKDRQLGHAIQTGIAWKLAIDHPEVTDVNQDSNLKEHKHLRVGIDTTKCEHGALAALLIESGVIDEDKYFKKVIEFLEREKKNYEDELSAHFGTKISLE